MRLDHSFLRILCETLGSFINRNVPVLFSLKELCSLEPGVKMGLSSAAGFRAPRLTKREVRGGFRESLGPPSSYITGHSSAGRGACFARRRSSGSIPLRLHNVFFEN